MTIRSIFASAAILVTVAAAGHAQSITDQVVSQLTAEGYSRIEVKRLGTTVKVEAQKGGRELEVIYDSATGAVLKEEVNPIRPGDDTTPGVYLSGRGDDNRSDRSQGRGGLLAGSVSDDGPNHDVGDDHGGMRDDDDDHDDDHGGMRGDDDDHDDDHGGMRDDDDDDDRRGGRRADDRDDDDDSGRGRGRGRSSDDD